MFRVAYKSDIGLKRSNNQDSIGICEDLGLCMVADGMGGYKGGELASAMAVEAIESIIKNADPEKDIQSLICDGIRLANQVIYLKALEDPELKGMGTTCSLVVIRDLIHVGHVGDSRVYFVKDDTLKQVTVDHTLVENLIQSGQIKREEAKIHPKRNVITRAVGSEPEVVIDYLEFKLSDADKIIICSDGLTGKIEDQEILEIVNTNPLEQSIQVLVNLANERGGSDNISIIIMELVD